MNILILRVYRETRELREKDRFITPSVVNIVCARKEPLHLFNVTDKIESSGGCCKAIDGNTKRATRDYE